MSNLLWIGDACGPTGFARVTHNVLARLMDVFDVTVLGVGYRGDPHPYPYPIYPSVRSLRDDLWGVNRFVSIVEKIKPDVVVINNDPWNVIKFINKVPDLPLIGYMPVDGLNMREDIAAWLSKLSLSVFYTKFGVDVAVAAGHTGPTAIIPHGVDTEFYHPIPKEKARHACGLDKYGDLFIVGNVNRNQPRKRLDLTISAFSRWVHKYDLPDTVRLLLHCGLKDVGWDLLQLGRYYDVDKRLMFTDSKMAEVIGIDERALPYVYSSLDVQISTTLGEGWGLTTMEGMACRVPQIVPRWAALGEWADGSAYFVPITSTVATGQAINTIGGVCDEESLVNALNMFYDNAELCDTYAELGYRRVHEERFGWNAVADAMANELSVFAQKANGKDHKDVSNLHL